MGFAPVEPGRAGQREQAVGRKRAAVVIEQLAVPFVPPGPSWGPFADAPGERTCGVVVAEKAQRDRDGVKRRKVAAAGLDDLAELPGAPGVALGERERQHRVVRPGLRLREELVRQFRRALRIARAEQGLSYVERRVVVL